MQKLHCYDLAHPAMRSLWWCNGGESRVTRYRELYRKTIDKWGEQAQYDQVIEECAELIATLQHFGRNKVDSDAVIDELADVYLMVGQLAYMFGEERLQEAIDRKLIKLEALLSAQDDI
jgi:NTP pyrophosphatase (non-canonical NTP hydrolase)